MGQGCVELSRQHIFTVLPWSLPHPFSPCHISSIPALL